MNPEFVERRVGPPLLRKAVGISRAAQWNRLRQTLDTPSWRSFGIAMGALAVALFLALYSGAAAEEGHLLVAGMSALSALALAGWVALTVVPALARRTPLGWLSYQIDYKLTREGIVYIVGIFVVALAALNTGNNLLFMVLACLLAGMLISGLLSRVVLGGIEVRLELPEHIFAQRTILAIAELHNAKQLTPSFSVSLVSEACAERQETCARPIPRRRFWIAPFIFRIFPTGRRCGKTSS